MLAWLQDWYARRCDGDWEHDHGVTIETLDNPGWLVRIALSGTGLAGRPFAPVSRGDSERDRDWLDCRVADDRFTGAGGAHNLEEILRVFQTWAAGRPGDEGDGRIGGGRE